MEKDLSREAIAEGSRIACSDLWVEEVPITGGIQVDDGLHVISNDRSQYWTLLQAEKRGGESIGSVCGMAQPSGRERICGTPCQQEPLGALQMVEESTIEVIDGIRMPVTEELLRVTPVTSAL